MLKINPRFTITIVTLLGLLFLSLNKAHAFNGVAGNVFKFQHKLAVSGNMQSQYKLGRMYETGRGTKQNQDEAMRWFSEASKNGFEPANDRITYYEVKQLGYDKQRYGGWVDSVIGKAKQRVPESMVLLAQMYTEGIGVKRNDDKALQLLHRLSMDGMSEVDADIAVIEARIASKQAKKTRPKAKRIVLKTPAKQSVSSPVVNNAVVKAASGQNIAGKVEAELIAKKKRYEAVMKKLQEEQRLLEAQQAWAEN